VKTILLRLEGPLQSWGTQGRFGIRDTEREPSKSGVLGLVGAALGMARNDHPTLAALRTLAFAIRVDREGTVLRDYHTAGGGSFRGHSYGVWSAEAKNPTAVTERYYLQDASFLVALSGEDEELLARIASALQHPKWALCLGRRACVPSEQVFVAFLESGPKEALCTHPIPERFRPAGAKEISVRLVLETADADRGSPRQDDPQSFELYARRHFVRYVTTEFVTLPLEAAPCS
jgi:CRISPR system Cascade subunit CasD